MSAFKKVQASCLVAAAVLTGVAACASQRAGPLPPPKTADNALLAELFQQDQSDQRGIDVPRSNDERVKAVLMELASGRVSTPEDEFRAAMVLDHTELTLRDGQYVAKSPYNYLLAHYLAQRSLERGDGHARTLVAQTIDRYLSLTEGRQKYGTSRIVNPATGREELVPVDRSVTDEERARYGVPPLAETLKRYPEVPRKQP